MNLLGNQLGCGGFPEKMKKNNNIFSGQKLNSHSVDLTICLNDRNSRATKSIKKSGNYKIHERRIFGRIPFEILGGISRIVEKIPEVISEKNMKKILVYPWINT